MKLTPIAFVSSPYKQKFAIPRQPNLVREAVGQVRFVREYADPNAVRGLEQFSHLWLIFLFHETADQGSSATVTPPRLGGTERMGVFATRSAFRPNPIGLSVVELAGVEHKGNELVLNVRGLDLLDGTPVLDIKPYLPYADAIPDASGGFAQHSPGTGLAVEFTALAEQQLLVFQSHFPDLRNFIIAVLKQDPRPAQHARKADERDYGMLLHDCNIRWRHTGAGCLVLSLEPAQDQAFTPIHPAR